MSLWNLRVLPLKAKIAFVGMTACSCVLIGLGAFVIASAAAGITPYTEGISTPTSYTASIPMVYGAASVQESYREYVMVEVEEQAPTPAPTQEPASEPAPEPKPETKPAPEPKPETKPEPQSPVTSYVTSAKWYVTRDEYSDRVGNLCSIYNYCRQEWANARQWCVDNYNAGWPYGPVKDKYEAKNFGVAVSMATAACCIRESSTVPDNMQNMGSAGTFNGSIGMQRSLQEAFNILEHPAYLQGYGIIQFTATNLTDFVTFCKAANLDPRLLDTQLKYMAYQYYSNDYIHRQYTYLEKYNDVAPTLSSVSELAQLHTSVIGMGNKPTAYYAKPSISVKNILRDWGTARYSDFTKSASGAYELLHTYATTGVIPR